MADEIDPFGDPELFAEFEKPREASDALLLETLRESKYDKAGSDSLNGTGGQGNAENQHTRFTLGSSDEESEGSESDDDNGSMGSDLGDVHSPDNACDSKELDSNEDVSSGPRKAPKQSKSCNNKVGDNKGSKGQINELQREIERLKKESILGMCVIGTERARICI